MLPDGGDLTFADLQYFRAARLADSDIFHGSSLSLGREMSNGIGKGNGHPCCEGVVNPFPAV